MICYLQAGDQISQQYNSVQVQWSENQGIADKRPDLSQKAQAPRAPISEGR